MPFRDSPAFAAWRHGHARAGFEVAFMHVGGSGRWVEGATTAVDDGEAWLVRYRIRLASDWTTRQARVVGQSEAGVRDATLDADGAGRWRINGAAAPALNGCLDVDLESSALTNAFPVHRLGLAIGERAQAPAAYVRAMDLGVERLEQRYERLDDDGDRQRYSYRAPQFEFSCELVYDAYGLVLDYPGIAVRAA
jgi:uncharacterized protein